MNEYFVRSEIEYQRQQRLAAATQHRRARGAARAQSMRSRLSAVVAHLRGPMMDLPRPRHSAENGSAARAA